MLDSFDKWDDVRGKVRSMMEFEEYHKKHIPKGKKYVGLKFKPFRDESGMGFKAVPVFEKEQKEGV